MFHCIHIVQCHYNYFPFQYSQVNVYANTRRQRMSYFEGFLRKALVVIPPHHELRKRRSERIRDGGCVDLPQDLMDAFKGTGHV